MGQADGAANLQVWLMSAALSTAGDVDVKPKYTATPFGDMPKGERKRKKEVTFTASDRIVQQAGMQDRFVLMGLESPEYVAKRVDGK